MASGRENEQPLKAIVFADDCCAFSSNNLAKGKKLLNIPILSWQLAILARYGVKEAIVLSSSPVPDVYSDPLDRMKVSNISSPSWDGEGDALRDVESRDGVRPTEDFVLVSYGSVFNVNVSELVSQHKSRRDVDRNWLITTVFRRGAGSASVGLVAAVDAASKTLVKYTSKDAGGRLSIDVSGDYSGLRDGGQLEICSDVLDIGLDICAPDFLLEFRENFYYSSVRAYIKEKLDGGSAEVYGNRMYVHFLDSKLGQFGTRITSLVSLAQATSDVLNGWMSPISEASICQQPSPVDQRDFSTEFLVERCSIGANASIAIGSTIIESVIGNNVKIGFDCTIVQSIIMDGTEIGDRVEIEKSIVGENCSIVEDSAIPRNCFLDQGVCIGHVRYPIPSHSFFTLRSVDEFVEDEGSNDDNEDDLNDASNQKLSPSRLEQSKDSQTSKQVDANSIEVAIEEWDAMHVGKGGIGRSVDGLVARTLDRFFSPQSMLDRTVESEDEDELEEDEDLSDEVETSANFESAVNGQVEDLEKAVEAVDIDCVPTSHDSGKLSNFEKEILETIERACAENIAVDNTTLEVNSLKMAYDGSFAETLTGVLSSIALNVKKTVESNEPNALYAALASTLSKYRSLISKFNKEDESFQIQVASGIASLLRENPDMVKYLFKAMYEYDMIDEEGILGWAITEKRQAKNGDVDSSLLVELTPLLEWLEDSEDEDE